MSIQSTIRECDRANIQKICIIDNNDSFTHNLVQIVWKSGVSYEVKKNTGFNINELESFNKILFSPGPGTPSEAGLMYEIISSFYKTKSLLGICLGHQAIAEIFGGEIYNLSKPLHGIKEEILVDSYEYLFEGISPTIDGGLYHSWAVVENSLPEELQVIAKSKSGLVMGISHKLYDVKGLQFHPESVMTPCGEKILRNWIERQ